MRVLIESNVLISAASYTLMRIRAYAPKKMTNISGLYWSRIDKEYP